MIEVSIDHDLKYGDDGLHYYEGHRYSGVGCDYFDDGRRRCIMTFVDGRVCGPAREWYASGQMMFDGAYEGELYDGMVKEWHPNGVLAHEGEYLRGIPVRTRSWDTEGHMTEEFAMHPGDSRYELYQSIVATLAAKRAVNQPPYGSPTL
jgi:antitoxin component YwqK of YwqJK toxin-antitoxin module